MRQVSEASIFKQKQTILRAKRASPPQELSKFGANRQFLVSIILELIVCKSYYSSYYLNEDDCIVSTTA